MLGRLIVGALVGTLLGGLVAAALVKGLGMVVFPVILAYVFAAVVGTLAGLFAGKPIWAAGGQIEAGLKAFFGALLAVGGMFAIRQWLHTSVDLSSFGAGAGEIGALPAVSLPLIAGVLGAIFGVDNTPDGDEKAGPKSKVKPNVRVAKAEADELEDEEESRASRKARH